jgi:predicted ArsR family transcriptional regulator
VRVLNKVANDKVAMLEPPLRDLPLSERVKTLKHWYLAEDPYMSVEPDGDDYRLIERNCPFYNTAMRRPILCNISVNALSRLLGVRVHREERFQNGDGRCVFRIHTNEPVEAGSAPFTLESPR